MLGNAAPTQADLRFSLFGIPVRVHPMFWLITAVLGWSSDLKLTALWVGCVFVSVLVHELGHALSARAFGWDPEIVLYSMGGYASFLPTRGYTTGRAIAVLLAGPGAGFVLFALVWGIRALMIERNWGPDDREQQFLLDRFFSNMVFINLWWGLVNLLPIYPLDGGQISREVFHWLRPRDGVQISLKLSLVTGAAIAAWFFSQHYTYGAILFAALALENFQYLQASRY